MVGVVNGYYAHSRAGDNLASIVGKNQVREHKASVFLATPTLWLVTCDKIGAVVSVENNGK